MAEPWLRLRPGSELALVLGLMRILVVEGEGGLEAPGGHKEGRESLRKTLEGLDPSDLEAMTGLKGETLREVASALSSTRRCAIVFGAGVSQSRGGLDKVRALANLAAVVGCVGVGGGGIYPLDRGANTQGACDMGTLPEWLPGYRPVDEPGARAAAVHLWGKEPPGGPGWTLCEMIEAARRGELKALYVMGENPLAVLPREAREALEGLDLLIVQDLFLTESAARAHLVLPGAGFAEKNGTYTSVERRIQRVRAAMDPPGEARPDWWILAEVLRRLGVDGEYDTAADVMKEICEAIPEYGGVQYSRLEKGGLFWPCLDDHSMGEAILHRGGIGGARPELGSPDPTCGLLPDDPEHPWIALRGATQFHFQGGTRSGRSLRLRGWVPKSQVCLNPLDLAGLGVSDGDGIRLASPHGSMSAVARPHSGVPSGVAWVILGPMGGGMADLMAWEWDPVSKMPQLYAARVRIERA
jgi:predicted molibdopterin-dependent oxidoreductase YjgC